MQNRHDNPWIRQNPGRFIPEFPESQIPEPEPSAETIQVGDLAPPRIFRELHNSDGFSVFKVDDSLVIDWADKVEQEQQPKIKFVKVSLIGSAAIQLIAQGEAQIFSHPPSMGLAMGTAASLWFTGYVGVKALEEKKRLKETHELVPPSPDDLLERAGDMKHAIALRSENLKATLANSDELSSETAAGLDLTMRTADVLGAMSDFGIHTHVMAFDNAPVADADTKTIIRFNPMYVVHNLLARSSNPDQFLTDSFGSVLELYSSQKFPDETAEPSVGTLTALEHTLQIGAHWLAIEHSELKLDLAEALGILHETERDPDIRAAKESALQDISESLKDALGSHAMLQAIRHARQELSHITGQ